MIYTTRLWKTTLLDQVVVVLAASTNLPRRTKSKLSPRSADDTIGPVVRRLGRGSGW